MEIALNYLPVFYELKVENWPIECKIVESCFVLDLQHLSGDFAGWRAEEWHHHINFHWMVRMYLIGLNQIPNGGPDIDVVENKLVRCGLTFRGLT